MADDKEFLIKVKADIRQSLREMRRMSGEIRTTGKASARSSRQVSSLGRSMTQLKTAAAAYLSLRTAQNLAREADAFNVLQSRIKTATKDTGDYVAVSKELFAISQQNGTALETTVSLFQSLARSAPELGASSDQILELTRAVQQLGVISGAAPANLSAALLQFSQGLAAGVFRAQEFNSLQENAAEIAVRIAKGLGLTVAELRKAVIEGHLLSRSVFESLLGQAPEIAQEFESIPDSLARSTQRLGNAFDKFLAQIDQATGVTRTLARFFTEAAESLAGIGEDVTGLDSFDLAIDRIQRKVEFLKHNLDEGLFSPRATTEALDKLIALEKLLAVLQQQRADFGKQQATADADSEPGNRPAPLSADQQAALDRSEKTVAALELEAATYGKTAGEIALYKLQLEGATQAQRDRAAAAVASINADEQFEATVRASEQAVKDENEAYQDWLKTLNEEGRQVVQDTLTDQERLSQSIARYRELLAAGALSQDEFNRAVASARADFEEMQRAGDDTFNSLTAAVRGWGNEFTDTLADMVIDGKANFGDLANSIIRDLIKIQIEMRATRPLLQAGTQGLNAVFGFASGGPVTGPGTATSDSIPARLSAGEYVVSAKAVSRYGPQLLEAINQMRLPRFANVPPITRISTPGTHFAEGGLATPGAGSAGEVTINVTNKGQPVRVDDAQVRFDPKGLVVDVILSDLREGGPVSNNFAGAFGLRRKPR